MAGVATKLSLQWPDGSAVTAQEVYDAAMSGIVYFEGSDYSLYTLSDFSWADAAGTQEDSTNVVAVDVTVSDDNVIRVGVWPE